MDGDERCAVFLATSCRVALGRAFDAFRPALLESGALRGGLLASLLADAERFAAGAEGAADLTQLLGAAACLVPMLKAAPRSEAAAETAAAMRRLTGCFLAALKALSGADASKADLAAASIEISGHLHALSKLGLWLAAPRQPEAGGESKAPAPPRRILQRAPTPASGSSEGTAPAASHVSVQITVQEEAPRDILSEFKSMAIFSSASPAPAGPCAAVQLQLHPGSSEQPPAPGASAPAASAGFLLDLYEEVLGITLAALAIPEISEAPRAVAGAVAALGSWARVLQQQEGPAFAEPLTALCGNGGGGGGGSSALAALTAYDDEAVLRQLAKVYLTCLRRERSLGCLLGQAASAAELVGRPAQDSSAATAQLEFLLGLLARPEAGLSSEGALAVWKAAMPLAHPDGGCLAVVFATWSAAAISR